ncbi:hypothetical protein NE237_028333 [Protea cynaroides]|uniref:Uncharacterized protein n=1 Tax=Protea cynaroides TaxID=273540 RepID=A0A9Q0GP69_9MAGN|nr:hypothetical protein NE237_028333 [Protea cynaroides]
MTHFLQSDVSVHFRLFPLIEIREAERKISELELVTTGSPSMKKPEVKEEVIAEDYCFVCKDGGLLLVCEYERCCKAYHAECVGKDVTFLETGEFWTCSWHICFICHKNSQFHCFCCPIAVCRRCIKAAEFVIVRGNMGFCNDCLNLALLIEENVDVDSDGGKVDFKDKDTYECLFMGYWEMIKEKACLKLETLHLADVQLKKDKGYLGGSQGCSFLKGEEDVLVLSSEGEHVDSKMVDGEFQCMDEPDRWQFTTKMRRKGKVKSKKKIIGWGSRSLIEFLASNGIDTSKQISLPELNSIITKYIDKNNLMHPVKKKKVLCDLRLRSVFGRKSINQTKIFGLLQSRFYGNQEQPEEDKFKCSLQDKGKDGSSSRKRQRMTSSDRKSHKKVEVLKVPQSCFASITPRNIRLVYLRRSLVEYLLKTPETFKEKVVGSFVRVKCEHHDCLQNSHQLLQVTGIKKVLRTSDVSAEIVLQVSDMKKEIYIQMLSDDDFPEGECDDLHHRVKDGSMKKPTIVELEQKARILHEDITNYRIDKELVRLQNLIDRANEKGWRRDLSEYLERRQVLQTPSERLRLLQEIPIIIAEEVELEASPEDSPSDGKERKDDSPRLILVESENGDGIGDESGSNQNPEKRVVEESDYTKHTKTQFMCKPSRISLKMLSSATTTSAGVGMRSHATSQPNMETGVPLTFPPSCDVFIPGYPGWTIPIYETATEVEIPRPPSVPGIPLPKDIEWVPRQRVEDLMCMVAGLKDMVRRYSHDILVMRNTTDKFRTSQCSNQERGDAEEAVRGSEKEKGVGNNGDGDLDRGE